MVAAAGVTAAFAFGATGARAPTAGQIAYDLGDRLLIVDLDGANSRLIRTPKQKQTHGTMVWSPDGSALALARYDDRRRSADVYVAVVADGTLTRVAHLPGSVGAPRWSPEGTQIAFSWQSRRACDPGTTGTTSIFVADARGGGARRLVSVEPKRPSTKRTPYFTVLDWNPDGTRLLYGDEAWRTGETAASARPVTS